MSFVYGSRNARCGVHCIRCAPYVQQAGNQPLGLIFWRPGSWTFNFQYADTRH